jgi:ribosome-binding protein aMBF1 (putative translation factor)
MFGDCFVLCYDACKGGVAMYSLQEYCGLLVKQAREEKNWTQQDLADEVDMDVRTIKKIEEGTTSSYYLTIEKLIYALNIAPNIMCHAELSDKGIFMDRLYRQLFTLDVESLKIVCDSATYIRNWHEKQQIKDNEASSENTAAQQTWRYSSRSGRKQHRSKDELYSPEEKEEIENVIAVFSEYIKESAYVDIVWSDKLGYVFLNIDLDNLSIDMEPIIIESADEMVQELLYEISNDVMDSTSHEHSLEEVPLDLRLEIESRFRPYLEKLPQYRYVADNMFKSKD